MACPCVGLSVLDVVFIPFVGVCLPFQGNAVVGPFPDAAMPPVCVSAASRIEQAAQQFPEIHQAVQRDEEQDEKFFVLFPVYAFVVDDRGAQIVLLREDERPDGHGYETAEWDDFILDDNHFFNRFSITCFLLQPKGSKLTCTQ